MRQVSIIGIGETKFGKLESFSLRDLIRQAGNAAIEDAGIDKSRIQALYMGNATSAILCKQLTIGPLAVETLELNSIPSMRLEGACASGSLAFRQGLLAIACGLYDIVLIGGVEKMTHQDSATVTGVIASGEDAEQEVAAGITFPSIFAMVANRYSYEYGDARRAMSACAINNHYNATLNPDAQLHKIITEEDVLNGMPIASPFTINDCSLVSDGAAFVVLAATDVAKTLNRKHRRVDVIGSGHGGDIMTLYNKKSLTSFTAAKQARKEAFEMAAITTDDVDIVEVHDCFTISQIIAIEDLGFFEKGEGAKAVLEGKIARNGQIPVNVSGGLKAKGHPIGATGLAQIFEITTQIRGDAGKRQINNVNIGVTHNLGGAGGTATVHVLKGD